MNNEEIQELLNEERTFSLSVGIRLERNRIYRWLSERMDSEQFFETGYEELNDILRELGPDDYE